MLRLNLLAGLVLRKDQAVDADLVTIKGSEITIGPEKNRPGPHNADRATPSPADSPQPPGDCEPV